MTFLARARVKMTSFQEPGYAFGLILNGAETPQFALFPKALVCAERLVPDDVGEIFVCALVLTEKARQEGLYPTVAAVIWPEDEAVMPVHDALEMFTPAAVRDRLASIGLRVSDLCAKAGVSAPTFANWEQAKGAPNVATILAFERALVDLEAESRRAA
jgi:hypothetical protein